MSYILDALRKADAERARGTVPTLHAQPVSADAATAGAVRGVRWRWWLLGSAAGVLVAFVWLLAGREPASVPTPAPTLAPPAPPRVGEKPAPAPATLSAPSVSVVLPPPPAAIALPALPAPAASRAEPPRPLVAAAPAVPPSAAAASARVPTLAELPVDLRRQIPPLAFSGSVYSEQPASRFVMINGQLLREGERVAPNLVLERIGPKSAVLRWRDQRFEAAW